MITLVNDTRHLTATILGICKVITLRVNLKGTSFDGRQETLRHIYNEHLLEKNPFTYTTKTWNRTVEIITKRNEITKSIGFIPEEIIRVLKANGKPYVRVDGVEIRKHIGGSSIMYGAVVRIATDIDTSEYMRIVKEFETSIIQGPSKEDPYERAARTGTDHVKTTGTAKRAKKASNRREDKHTRSV